MYVWLLRTYFKTHMAQRLFPTSLEEFYLPKDNTFPKVENATRTC